MIFNDVQGGAPSSPSTIAIENQGSAGLTVSDIQITGADAGQFQLVSTPSLPTTIPIGGSVNVQVAFAPTSVGPKGAFLQITSDDPDTPQLSVPLRGLGTLGTGGSNEPSLQWIMDTYQIPIDVGDPDPTNSSMPSSPLLGDEVPMQRFVKAGPGPVTIEPLAVFGPDGSNPVVRMGWYPSGNAAGKNELFTVSNTPVSNAQTLNVPVTGTTQFDPGSAVFGLYSVWPFFSNREIFSEDALNTFTGAIPHHVRVYPLRTSGGQLVPNSYVVTTEESTSGFDYNDVVYEIDNVAAPPSSSGAEIGLTNLDGAPADNRLVFNRIGTLNSPPSNIVHDRATVRIESEGSDPLTVSALTINGPWQIVTPPALPATIAAGDHLDVTLRLVATSGDVQLGSLSITSNDGNEPVTTVQLAGFWQSVSEGGQEPKLAELMQIYGYGTQINIPGQQPLNQAGLVTAVGDEVLSPYWRRADPTVPVQVRQLNAFHTQGNNATLRWYPKGTTTLTALFTMEGQEAQSLLPHKNNQPTQFAAGSFAPTGAFGFKLDNEWSDDTKNNQTVDQSNGCPGPCGHHVRFWPLVDGSGNIVPNTWLMSMDYAGVNYDYNDNTFLISNMRPDDATKDPSRQALVPGAPGLVLDFDGTHPNTLVDKDGQPTGFTSTQPNRNDTTTTSDSYQSGLLDLNTAAPGTLAVTTTAGSNAGTDNTQVNGLQLRYDSSLDDSTVRARLIGPFDQFSSGSRQGGIMFGTNQDNYVKLAVTNKNGVPKLELFSEVGGTGTSVSTVTLPNPATLQTLDLYLIPDPATRHVRAAYRAVGPGGDTGIVLLPIDAVIPIAQQGRFFAHNGAAGIITSHKGSTPMTVTFDSFSVTPGDVTAGPDQRQALTRLDVAGAGPYTDTNGKQWVPDIGLFSPSSAIAEGANVQPQEIANTNDDVIYRTYRGNVGNVGQAQRVLTYQIPTQGLTNMDLRLHFAERASGNDMPGDRLFDVVAEGDTVLHNFDILSASGGQNTATVVPINGVHVTDGFLTLVFRAEADYPSIAGIEVLCPGACPPPDTTPPPAPGSLTASVVGPDVQLDWPTVAGDTGGYNVYRSSTSGGPYTLLNQGLVTVSRYTDARSRAGHLVLPGDHGRHGGQRIGACPDERHGRPGDGHVHDGELVHGRPEPPPEARGPRRGGQREVLSLRRVLRREPADVHADHTGGLLRSRDRHLDQDRGPPCRTLARGRGRGRDGHLHRRRISRPSGRHGTELLDHGRVEVRHAHEHVHLDAAASGRTGRRRARRARRVPALLRRVEPLTW